MVVLAVLQISLQLVLPLALHEASEPVGAAQPSADATQWIERWVRASFFAPAHGGELKRVNSPALELGLRIKKEDGGEPESGADAKMDSGSSTQRSWAGGGQWRTWDIGQLPENLRKKFVTITREVAPWSVVFGQARSSDRDPWTSISIASLVEHWIEKLPADQKAALDLIILERIESGGRSSQRALLPRWLVNKYPVRLAWERKGSPLAGERGPWAVVIPWSVQKSVGREELPLKRLSGEGFNRVTLTNYRTQFSSLFLKKRSDPVSMRGEKLFVQNCMTCHGAGLAPELPLHPSAVVTLSGVGATLSNGSGSPERADSVDSKIRKVADSGHPSVQGGPTWSFKDRRALVNYLESYRKENPASSRQAVR